MLITFNMITEGGKLNHGRILTFFKTTSEHPSYGFILRGLFTRKGKVLDPDTFEPKDAKVKNWYRFVFRKKKFHISKSMLQV